MELKTVSERIGVKEIFLKYLTYLSHFFFCFVSLIDLDDEDPRTGVRKPLPVENKEDTEKNKTDTVFVPEAEPSKKDKVCFYFVFSIRICASSHALYIYLYTLF